MARWVRSAMIVMVLGVTGCSGGDGSSGGGSGGNAAPIANVVFPLAASLSTGALISVRGTAVDADGDTIAAVTVNDVASVSTDGFATWQVAALPLQDGDNTLQGRVRDVHGIESTFSIAIERRGNPGTLMSEPLALAIDPRGGGNSRLLVMDRGADSVLTVDLNAGADTGKRAVVSPPSTDGSPRLVASGMSVDAARNRVLVSDFNFLNQGKVIEVDLASGLRNVLVEGFHSTGALIVDPVNGRFLVGDTNLVAGSNGVDGVFEFDLANPALSGYDPANRPGSPNLVVNGIPSSSSMALDPNDPNRVLVTSARVGVNAVFAVDVDARTKNRIATFVAPTPTTTFFGPDAIAFFPGDSNRALVATAGSLVQLELGNAAKTLVSGPNNQTETGNALIRGKGPRFTEFNSMLFDPADGNRAYVLPQNTNKVFTVDLVTGDRRALDAGVGNGPELLGPGRLALLPNPVAGQAPTLVVLDDIVNLDKILYTVDLAATDTAADRVLLSGYDQDNPNQPRGSGPTLRFPTDLLADTVNQRVLIADEGLDAVVAADLATGDRTLLFGSGAGTDPIDRPRALTMDTANDRLLVATSVALLAVALNSGTVQVISDADTGTGPQLLLPTAVALDAANNRVLLVQGLPDDGVPSQLVAIDLTTGNRTVLSQDGVAGAGVAMAAPESLVIDIRGNRALVLDSELAALVAVDLATGDRSLLSASNPGPDGEFNTDDDQNTGNGAPFNVRADLSGAAWDDNAQILYVTDRAAGSVIAIDAISGDRVLVSGFTF